VPTFTSSMVLQQVFFVITYFLSGFVGALAETGCIILVAHKFPDEPQRVMAAVCTACGVGCWVGPLLGGVVYDYGSHISVGRFLSPFILFSGLLLVSAIVLVWSIPEEYIGAGESAHTAEAPGYLGRSCHSCQSVLDLLTSTMCLDFLAVALSGTVVAMLDPTLQYRIGEGSSLGMSSTMVGTWFMLSSITYVVASVPIGLLADKYKAKQFVLKSIIAAGFLFLALSFALLGPFFLPGLGTVLAFDNLFCVTLGVCIKGIGSAATVIPVYGDLTAGLGLPEDNEMLFATISGLWNAAYATGWALGPMLGGILYQALQFDGFATVVCCCCSVFALVMFIAAIGHTCLGCKCSDGAHTIRVRTMPIPARNDAKDVSQSMAPLRAAQLAATSQLLEACADFKASNAQPSGDVAEEGQGHRGMPPFSFAEGYWPLLTPHAPINSGPGGVVQCLIVVFNGNMEGCISLNEAQEDYRAEIAELELGAARALFAWLLTTQAHAKQDVSSLVSEWDTLLASQPDSFLEHSKTIPGPFTLYEWCMHPQRSAEPPINSPPSPQAVVPQSQSLPPADWEHQSLTGWYTPPTSSRSRDRGHSCESMASI